MGPANLSISIYSVCPSTGSYPYMTLGIMNDTYIKPGDSRTYFAVSSTVANTAYSLRAEVGGQGKEKFI